MDHDEAVRLAVKTLESQGGRPRRDAVEALVLALEQGQAPKTYGERFVQMALQHAGYLASGQETDQ